MKKIEEAVIKINSEKLYSMLEKGKSYTFTQLQIISHFDNINLCLVLIQLIRENRIEQRNEEGICYLKMVFQR